MNKGHLLAGARRCFLAGGLGLCAASSACQTVLVPNDEIPSQGRELRGWVQQADALVYLEVFDHCSQAWREVARAVVDPEPASLGPHSGHAWQAQLLPTSFSDPHCLFQEGASLSSQKGGARPSLRSTVMKPTFQDDATLQSGSSPGSSHQTPSKPFSFRVQVRQGSSQQILPSLGAKALQCLMDSPWQSNSAAQLLADCETFAKLPLFASSGCPEGQKMRTQAVSLSKAGNFRRLWDPLSPQESALLYHFEDSLLVGREPPTFGMEREYRNYLLFERPELPSDIAPDGDIQAAWISWFSNFDTALCAHREDIGCGYASEDRYEDFLVSWVDLVQHADPRSIPYGLALKHKSSLQSLFSAMEQAPVLTQLRMQPKDVDRWFSLPLGRSALQNINAVAPGQSMMFAGRVREDAARAATNELLFVDHLVGTSLDASLEPKLYLAYCAETSPRS